MKCFSRSCERIRIEMKRPVGVMLITMIVVMGLFSGPLSAASPGRLPSSNEGQQPVLSKAHTTIEKKSLQRIFTYGQTYAVNDETLIVGSDGREVALKKMLVPCDVEVSYLIENGIRTAKRIAIKRIAEGASCNWVSEQPE
jgi:hypothetical protein